MPITVNQNTYSTIADAARQLGVSAKTVRDWIKKRIIDEPPLIEYGVRTVQYFPPDYIHKAKSQLDHYRKHKRLDSKRGNVNAY